MKDPREEDAALSEEIEFFKFHWPERGDDGCPANDFDEAVLADWKAKAKTLEQTEERLVSIIINLMNSAKNSYGEAAMELESRGFSAKLTECTLEDFEDN